MACLFDTNHCIYLMNGWNTPIAKLSECEQNTITAFHHTKDNVIFMSEASVGELWYGIGRSQRQTYNRTRINVLLGAVPPLPVNREIWELYGQTKAELSKVGKVIPDIDLVIASTAKHHQMTLIANDKHMRHLPSSFLRKNWAAGEY